MRHFRQMLSSPDAKKDMLLLAGATTLMAGLFYTAHKQAKRNEAAFNALPAERQNEIRKEDLANQYRGAYGFYNEYALRQMHDNNKSLGDTKKPKDEYRSLDKVCPGK